MRNNTHFDIKSQQLVCEGEWDLANLPAIKSILNNIQWPSDDILIIDGTAVTKMDTSGAWMLNDLVQQLTEKFVSVHFENFSPQHQSLLSIIQQRIIDESQIPKRTFIPWIGRIGKIVTQQINQFQQYLIFIGQLTYETIRITFHPKHIRWASTASIIDKDGYKALPIIALLSFLIGVVITYQMALQLRNYGANIFIVDLLGLSVLREFGPLLTAIMVAGRTGSAFTAQLGIMKINEEIDALNTMGVTPGELLLLPRIFGLVIALPLLTMWSDIFGILGGMAMTNNMLGITWYDFLHRFQHVIPLRTLIIGIGKAPVFALIIASIGCFQGIQVSGSAESIGKNTTRSVVLSIFFIIVADAAFSIIFSKLKL